MRHTGLQAFCFLAMGCALIAGSYGLADAAIAMLLGCAYITLHEK